jgi:hypothetical protein|tara:strand:- start:456 stop:1277 length:822 start_codon:yes stop_codon:yes gene_type:complete
MSSQKVQENSTTDAGSEAEKDTDIETENNDYDSESTLEDDEIREETDLVAIPEEVIVTEPVVKAKRKYTRKPPKKTLNTSDPNIQVEIKTKKKGPPKRVITIYKEDIEPDQVVIREKIKRKAGRPKSQKPIEVIEDDGEEMVLVPKPHPQKELTRKQLKELELHTKLAELQLVSGNDKLKLNKKGQIDKRMVKTRTAKQLQATKNLIELNKARREAKKQKDKKEILDEQKGVVHNIINSLNQTQVVDNKAAENEQQIKAQKLIDKKQALSVFD